MMTSDIVRINKCHPDKDMILIGVRVAKGGNHFQRDTIIGILSSLSGKY